MAKKERAGRKGWKIAIWGALGACLLVVSGMFAYTQYLLGTVQRNPDWQLETVSEEEYMRLWGDEDIEEPESLEFLRETQPTAPVPISETARVVNILLIGQDRRPGQKNRARSDAMILCTINKTAGKLTLTSFMRDMYVKIPGKKSNRINAAYAMGGTKLLQRCIEENFGIAIHGNVVVDFAAFTEAVDLVGGVDVQMTGKEAVYLNTITYKDQQRWQTGFQEGINHLDGNQALAYARIRKIAGNDFGRTNRQRKILSALIDKASGLSLPQLHRLLTALLSKVATDMTNGQILSYAAELLPVLSDMQIESQQIPASGAYRSTTVRGMQVLLPDMDKNRKILEELMS